MLSSFFLSFAQNRVTYKYKRTTLFADTITTTQSTTTSDSVDVNVWDEIGKGSTIFFMMDTGAFSQSLVPRVSISVNPLIKLTGDNDTTLVPIKHATNASADTIIDSIYAINQWYYANVDSLPYAKALRFYFSVKQKAGSDSTTVYIKSYLIHR